MDAHGKPVALSGVSFFWSNTGWGQDRFYQAATVDYFVTDWHASLVRAAIGADAVGGYMQDPKANAARLDTVIDAAVKDASTFSSIGIRITRIKTPRRPSLSSRPSRANTAVCPM